MMKGVIFLFSSFVMQCYCKFNRSCTMVMYMYCIRDLIFILFKILQPGMEVQDFPEIGEWNLKKFENFLTKFTRCD